MLKASNSISNHLLKHSWIRRDVNLLCILFLILGSVFLLWQMLLILSCNRHLNFYALLWCSQNESIGYSKKKYSNVFIDNNAIVADGAETKSKTRNAIKVQMHNYYWTIFKNGIFVVYWTSGELSFENREKLAETFFFWTSAMMLYRQ